MKRMILASLALCALLAACATSGPPSRQDNACEIFEQRPQWYRAALKSAERWGAPVSIQMAIIWKESSFRADARPPKTYTFFGLIPTGRQSSAYGYAQAIDGTWDWYLDEAGRWGADRDDFDDATDFVGWYMNKTRQVNGVSMGDAYNQYLAYHEGHTGYRRGSYRNKAWLLRAARRVADQADRYATQLRSCGGEL